MEQGVGNSGVWYDQLSAESLGKEELGFTPLTTVNTRDLHSDTSNINKGNEKGLQQCRRGRIPLRLVAGRVAFVGSGTLNDIAEKTLPDIMSAAIAGTNQALRDDGRPYTICTYPASMNSTWGSFSR